MNSMNPMTPGVAVTELADDVATQVGYSLWLLPEIAWAARLDALVMQLAPSFGCPVFQAHMTVQGDLGVSQSILEAVLDSVKSMPLEFELAGVETSEAYFRSFYLRLHDNPVFRTLQTQVSTQTGTGLGLSPFPHVSLAYGEPADPLVKSRWREVLASAGLPVTLRFDRLALVRSSRQVPIGQWAVLRMQRLG